MFRQVIPLRPIKKRADEALKELGSTFDQMYGSTGRPSIPPETLLKSMLLMALYSVRSERLFCEMLDYNLLYRWFLDMDMVQESFHHSAFSHNRDRLLEHEVAHLFLQAIVMQARNENLISDEHFSVDGTLIEAWASMKSFRPKEERRDDDDDSNGWADFRSKTRSNETHESKTDPDAMLRRKGRGKEAKLCFSAHALMENRHGLVLDVRVDRADGHSERRQALEMLDETLEGSRRITLGADAGYHTKDFVGDCRDRNVTPHVAAKKHSAIDRRTTRHAGYLASQKVRKRIEQVFGWFKTIGGLRKTRYRGIPPNQMLASITAAALNLTRIAKLAA